MEDNMTDQTHDKEVIELDNGNTLTLAREGRYNLIRMKLSEGNLPQKYQGQYTDMVSAKHAADTYIEERKVELEAIVKMMDEVASKPKKAKAA